MNNSDIIQVAAFAGKIILENGAETYRVEETISRICMAFGLDEAESFVMPTGIIISIRDKKGDTASIVKRIKERKVNLENVVAVNELSRRICSDEITLEEMKIKLNEIKNQPSYNRWILMFFTGMASAFFTLIFKGTFADFLVAGFIGISLKYFIILLTEIKTNDFFVNIFGGAFIAIIALICVNFNFGDNLDIIIIGSIMPLVPGLLITNAIRDTISGDLVSGISRMAEAIIVAGAIAIGTGLVLKLWIGVFGGSI
ncbi:threonine/serine exporter family protein [Clostridium sp. DL1XJH146]